MAKTAYIGIDNVAQEIAKGYIGIPNFEKRDLPEGYTQVAYIESSGTQWIDTGIKPNQDTRVNMTVSGWAASETSTSVFGSRSSASSKDSFMLLVSGSQTYRSDYGGDSETLASSVTFDGKIEIERNGNVTTMNGHTFTNAESDFSCAYSLFLMATNTGGSASHKSKAKLHACQVVHDGVLFDYVPCITADGTAGVYDVANGVFHGNAGTGTFTAGTTAQNTARKIKKAYIGVPNFTKRNLPEGYTQVEYIQSSGTQYIDTGVTSTPTVSASFKAQTVTADNSTILLGTYGGTSASEMVAFYIYGGKYYFKRGGSAYTIPIAADTNVHEILWQAGSVVIDGTSYSMDGEGRALLPFFLFAHNNNGTAGLFAKARLYECKFYDNGTLIRDFVPCKNADSDAGLYDMVEGKFYANAGSGGFTAGTSEYVGIAHECWSALDLVSWAAGTDEQIVAMVEAADRGEISLADYWTVGDQRTFTLTSGEEVTFVLLNKGGKTLTSGGTCNFIVGMKNSMKSVGSMNGSNTNTGGWKNCSRRAWCNSTFYNYIPATLKPIFKQFKNMTGCGNRASEGLVETDDYFALAAEVELLGTTNYSISGEGSQFQYYKTTANRKKTLGNGGSAYGYHSRSSAKNNAVGYFYMTGEYGGDTGGATYNTGISPFGCI